MLGEQAIGKIDWKKVGGLLPVVVQDSDCLNVLMLGYMNAEALQKTLTEGEVSFFSRSKNRLWKKGETSGNTLSLVDFRLDCDNDSAVALVKPVGKTCHLGSKSCFDQRSDLPLDTLCRLDSVISSSAAKNNKNSYTNSLLSEGLDRIVQKVGEEAVEVVIAAKNNDQIDLKNEVADLLYHLTVMLKVKNIPWPQVKAVLLSREKA